jgi:hypothetical protein
VFRVQTRKIVRTPMHIKVTENKIGCLTLLMKRNDDVKHSISNYRCVTIIATIQLHDVTNLE